MSADRVQWGLAPGQTAGQLGQPWPSRPQPIDDKDHEIPAHYVLPVTAVGWVNAAGITGQYALDRWGTTTGVNARAIIASPIFDLRPDLEGNYRPEAARIPGASRYFVQLSRPTGAFLSAMDSDLEAYSVELVNPYTPGSPSNASQPNGATVQAMGERVSITTAVYNGSESALLEWVPPGGPIRFWQVAIVLDWFGVFGERPALQYSAGAY
jgi:hypothetical protein